MSIGIFARKEYRDAHTLANGEWSVWEEVFIDCGQGEELRAGSICKFSKAITNLRISCILIPAKRATVLI
jgi:hypothetical protein